jgi:two-component system OmpR family sensor kinase
MSSSRPTDISSTPKARWRNPAGWSLRTRLVATMIALVALLGIVVGATTVLALNQVLTKQLDKQLVDASHRPAPPEIFGLVDNRNDGNGHGPVRDPNTLIVGVVGGKVFKALRYTAESQEQTLPADALTALAGMSPGNAPQDYDLGDLGEYRLLATQDPFTDNTVITGLPLSRNQAIQAGVVVVAVGATLIALIIAGFAGAFIVRRTLKPLSRVAATATKVSELKLDRGAVDLEQRVPEADTDLRTEVGQVGAALNRMLDHVGNALEARHASEMQVRQFVADASHELRTPLAAIRGYAELSRRSRSPVPDEVAHVLRRVESEAQRMTTLVEDLLLLARLDAGRPLVQEPVDLTMLVVDAVSDAHAAGPRHDWQLDLPDEPVTISGDPARLHQVLANLLANARTHTPEGTTVTVGVGAEPDGAVLRVCDRGPGIPAELLPHIFERFARGDSSRSRAAGSTGLGLSIVHAVVTAHHGTVSVQSEPGSTSFVVRLPAGVELSGGPDAVEQHLPELVQ